MTYAAHRLRILMILLVGAAALLAGCGTETSASVKPTATTIRNATATPIPTMLYQADWSGGAGGWTLPAHWSIKDGMLLNDGGGVESILIPYTVMVPDYEVDLVARVVNVASPQNCGNLYGMEALDTTGTEIYHAQIYCMGTNPQNPAESLLDVTAAGVERYATADFALNNDWKTFRVQVHNKGIRYFPNSSAANGGVNSPVALSPVSFGLVDQYVQLEISKFTVLKLNAIG